MFTIIIIIKIFPDDWSKLIDIQRVALRLLLLLPNLGESIRISRMSSLKC